MNEEKLRDIQFLLDLVVDKLIGITGIKDYSDFILRYKLNEAESTSLMDEVALMEEEAKQDRTGAEKEILSRLSKFNSNRLSSPVTFTREALQLLSPETLFKMYFSDIQP